MRQAEKLGQRVLISNGRHAAKSGLSDLLDTIMEDAGQFSSQGSRGWGWVGMGRVDGGWGYLGDITAYKHTQVALLRLTTERQVRD